MPEPRQFYFSDKDPIAVTDTDKTEHLVGNGWMAITEEEYADLKTRANVIQEGDRVMKVGTEAQFEGDVVSVFKKKNGSVRYVVEDDRGLLLIQGPKTVAKVKT